MKKLFTLFLSLFLALPTLWAEDIYFEILPFHDVYWLEIDLQQVIDNAAAYDRIIVTGSMTDANYTLTLTIPDNKTVVWKANYQATSGMLGTLVLL